MPTLLGCDGEAGVIAFFLRTFLDWNKGLTIPFNSPKFFSGNYARYFSSPEITLLPWEIRWRMKRLVTERDWREKGVCLKAPMPVSILSRISSQMQKVLRTLERHLVFYLLLHICLEWSWSHLWLWLLPFNPMKLELGSLAAPYCIPGKERDKEETK